jgi:undecaprenyl-diphosphatase
LEKIGRAGQKFMMELPQAIFLAMLQGLTEFLPISSSAHLVIPSLLLDWPDQGLAFDVAVHVGTLSAVLFYYREDLVRMAGRWLRSLTGSPSCDDSRMVWYLGLATVPAGLVGLFAGDIIELHLRTLPMIASTTLIFGLLLGFADRRAEPTGKGRSIGLAIALLVGLAQALALVPGVSRSGITMTVALMLGIDRQSSARFSFLLSIPIIASAGLLMVFELVASQHTVDWAMLGVGVVVSAVAAYLCIAAFLRLLDKVGLMPFVYYRVGLAGVLTLLWLT